MSLNSPKNITRRSWDTTLMPDTVIAHVNELSYNEPNKFIFTELIGCPIGDIYITGVDIDDAIEIKIIPHKTLLTSYGQYKSQRRIQSYHIPTLTLTSTTRHP